MIVLEFIIAVLICLGVPFLVGDLLLPEAALCKRYIMGILGTLAVAQLLFVPFIYFQQRFTPYFIAYVLIIAGICVYSVIKNHGHYKSEIKSMLATKNTIKRISPWMILALALIGFQVARVAFGHFFVYADNARYIPSINDLIETDRQAFLEYRTGEEGFEEKNIKYLFTSYYPYLASICKVSGLHPSILVQTILPVILTITLYGLIWHYGRLLFSKSTDAWLFVFIFGILVETISGYDYTYANHAISGIYFGKKIVFTILLPFILLFIAERTSLLDDEVVVLKKRDLLCLLIMVIGVCAPSLMGTGLAPVLLFCIGIVLSVRKKSAIPVLQMSVVMLPALIMLFMVIGYSLQKA